MTVERRSGENRPVVYRTERTADGSIKRTVTSGGAATVTVTGNDGVTTVTRPDGTKVSAEIGPDPRFGMQAPVTTRMIITTPGGRRTVMERSRLAELTNPDDVLSLRSLTETQTVNGRTHTTRFDAAAKRFTDAAPTGRTLVTEVDAQSRPLRVEVNGVTPSVFTYDAQGRLTRSSQGTRFEAYGYDPRGRVGTITDSLVALDRVHLRRRGPPDVADAPGRAHRGLRLRRQRQHALGHASGQAEALVRLFQPQLPAVLRAAAVARRRPTRPTATAWSPASPGPTAGRSATPTTPASG